MIKCVSMRVASLGYLGWDTHKFQKDSLVKKFKLLFGANQALQSLSMPFRQISLMLLMKIVFLLFMESLEDNSKQMAVEEQTMEKATMLFS